MNINRNNYEEFFLLYADNELSVTEKQAVDSFAAIHPDLKAELDMLLQTVLPEDVRAIFMDKESLFRTTDSTSLVNMTNYEGYFVKYADDELSNPEKAATEHFVYKNPECQVEFELIQQTKFYPDTSIQFPDKSILYRNQETKRRPVVVMWMRFAAAAILVFIAGLFWIQQRQVKPASGKESIAVIPTEQPAEKGSVNGKSITDENIRESPLVAKKLPANTVVQPKNKTLAGPQKEIQPAPLTLVAINDSRPLPEDPEVTDASAASNLPAIQIDQPAVIETTKLPATVYASNAASEDFIYIDNSPVNRKSPLRGLLRKASRYVEQKNPLSPDHKKGGVFTASQEQ